MRRIILFFLVSVFSTTSIFAYSDQNPYCLELQKLYPDEENKKTIGYLISSYTYGGENIEVRDELCRLSLMGFKKLEEGNGNHREDLQKARDFLQLAKNKRKISQVGYSKIKRVLEWQIKTPAEKDRYCNGKKMTEEEKDKLEEQVLAIFKTERKLYKGKRPVPTDEEVKAGLEKMRNSDALRKNRDPRCADGTRAVE